MDLLNSSVLSVVIGVAATILALSVFVQVLQELWKFLTSSRAKCYTKVLQDFLGPWATRMARPGILPEFQSRGPFQLLRFGPTGVLLPLAKPDLVEGLERTASPLVRRALGVLRTESELQQGRAGRPSEEWQRFASDLAAAQIENAEVPGPESQEIAELAHFISSNGLFEGPVPGDTVDATRALGVFRSRFLPHVRDAERHFGRLEELFQYEWRRRNMRQTFAFGVLVAFVFAQPINRILQNAQRLSPDQSLALAENALELYAAHEAMFRSDIEEQERTPPLTREQLDTALSESLDALGQAGEFEFNGLSVFLGTSDGRRDWGDRGWYLLFCLVTGALVSFGAPFWNDLLGVLVRIRRGPPGGEPQAKAALQPGAINV